MAERAKHAFGSLENIDQALANGTIDSYDILFVKDANGKPYVGWVDKQGNKVICDDSAEFAELETQIAAKADAEQIAELETELATKVSADEVDAKIDGAVTEKVETVVTEKVTEKVETVVNEKVETVITEKVDTVVNEKVETLVTEKVTEKVESTIVEVLAKTDKYEISGAPKGTLVDCNDKEIRIMCPTTSEWTKQAVGEGGDANSYYVTFKTYVPNDDVVGYIEHLGDQVDSEILTTFSTDEYGRRYQPTWLAVAKYDETTGTWNYYGAGSNKNHYVGWDYQIDWYNADGIIIESDCIRINLSNENCHSVIEPYYVNNVVGEVETKVETIVETKVDEAMDEKVEGAVNAAKEYTDLKIAEIEDSYGIIEF